MDSKITRKEWVKPIILDIASISETEGSDPGSGEATASAPS